MKIIFEFDYGHVEASTVKITESASGKTTKFYLSGRDGQMGTGKLRFVPVKGAKKEVLLEIDPFGDPLPTVKGSYTTAGKTVPFIVQKRRSTERLSCRFEFHERRQLFICSHNETRCVVAMRVSNPDPSFFANRRLKCGFSSQGCARRNGSLFQRFSRWKARFSHNCNFDDAMLAL